MFPSSCPLFQDIRPDEYEQMMRCFHAHLKSYRAGQLISTYDSDSRMIGVVLSGEASLVRQYRDGRQALLYSSMYCRSDRQGTIAGEKGYLIVKNINNPQRITVYDTDDREIARYDVPTQITGYEYEVYAAMEAVSQGKKECPQMPHAETLQVMELLDSLVLRGLDFLTGWLTLVIR